MRLLNSTLAALRAVRANKLRSALTILGIVFGVSSVIVMVAVGAGTRQRIEDDIRSLGANIVVLEPGAITSAGVRMGAGTKQTVTVADAVAIHNEVFSVMGVAPQVRAPRHQMVYGNANWSGPVVGTTPEYFAIASGNWPTGEYLTKTTLKRGARSHYLGAPLSRNCSAP